MSDTRLPPILSLGCAVVLAVSGAVALTDTDLNPTDQPVLGGHYQRAVESDFARNIPLRETSIRLWTALTYGVFGQTHSELVVGHDEWLFTAEEFRPADTDYDFVQEVSTTRDALAAEGIALVPVIIPDKARIYADHLPHRRDPELEVRYGRLLETLADLDLPTIDLVAPLIDGRSIAKTYMRTDTHWSPCGARIAATVIAEALEISGEVGDFSVHYGDPIAFAGDLNAFIDTGFLSDFIGPGPETISLPQTQSIGGGLFDQPEIEIVLVGTSYSARPEFNFPGFVSRSTGLEVVSLAVEGQGPFRPMRSALAGGSLTELTPSIVLWEIPERYISERTKP